VNREALFSELLSYVPADPREAESLGWMRRFVAAPEDPFARENPVGHVTASAVVARPGGEAFLLVFHRKLGHWLQPGGHVEHSDASAFEAALREASEETGIRIARFAAPLGGTVLDVDVHEIPARKSEPAHQHFDVRYLLTTQSEIDHEASDDRTRPIEWRSWEEAMSAGVDESLARALRKARSVLSGSFVVTGRG
jgi:8-oxo-dGTP pyrophosphatase MutT (NUDIX family)